MKYPIFPDNAVGAGPLMVELVFAPLFVFVLCTAHLFGTQRLPSLFLDIACIRQDSDAAKATGIAALRVRLDAPATA